MAFLTSTQIQCAACRNPFAAQLEQILDVGSDPAAKERLLSGQLNVATCPACGNVGLLNTPLLYHDPAHELLLVYTPMEMNLPQDQREQLIGGMTRTLMSRIPAEQRKGYLLNPQMVLTRDGLVERVLEADGIPREVLERQRKQSQLLNRLMSATDPELKPLIETNDELLDGPFFQMLAMIIDGARQAGRDEEAMRVLQLRNRLLPLASWSREQGITAQMLDEQQARLDLMERFLAADEVQWEALAKEHDRRLDYQFFQLLTALASGADGETATHLLRLRDRLVDLSSAGKQVKAGREAVNGLRAAADAAGGLTREMLLDRILQAQDDAAIEALALAGSPALDYSFFILMADRIDVAKKQGDQKEVDRIAQIREKLVALTERWEKEQATMMARVNQQVDELLAAADRPAAIEAALPEIDELFLSVLAGRAEAARRAGKKDTADQLARLLEQVLEQIRESAPPEIQLINDLLEIDDEPALQQVLEERKDELTSTALEMMQQMLADLRADKRDKLVGRVTRVLELAKKVTG